MNFSSWTNPVHSSAPHADFVCVNMLETTYIDSRDKRHWPLSLFQYGKTHGYRWPQKLKVMIQQWIPWDTPKIQQHIHIKQTKRWQWCRNWTIRHGMIAPLCCCFFLCLLKGLCSCASTLLRAKWSCLRVETNHELAGSMNSLKRKKNNPHNHATSSQYLKKSSNTNSSVAKAFPAISKAWFRASREVHVVWSPWNETSCELSPNVSIKFCKISY